MRLRQQPVPELLAELARLRVDLRPVCGSTAVVDPQVTRARLGVRRIIAELVRRRAALRQAGFSDSTGGRNT